MLRTCTLAAASLAAAVTLAAEAQPLPKSSGPAIGGQPASKLLSTKEALGRVDGRRTIRGRLTDGTPRLGDDSPYELHTATFSAGQRVTVNMVSSDFDTFLLFGRVSGGNFVQMAENDDGGEGVNARLELTIAEGGEYVFIANAAFSNGRGAYGLTVDAPGTGGSGSTAGGMTEAAIGTTVNGRLTPGEDGTLDDGSLFERVSFEARRGQRVELTLSSGDFDPVMALFHLGDGKPELLTSDDDGGEGSSSLIRFRAPFTGRYAVLVNGFGDSDTGAWTLRIAGLEAAERSPDVNWSARYTGGGSPDATYAVLVGIDDYPGVRSDLASCVVDTMEVRRVLENSLGVPAANIITINDADATRDHIVAAVRGHLGQAGPGGTAVFYFSGHGLQLDSDVGAADETADGKDEAIYVWGEDTRSSVIVDDELGVLFGELNAGRRLAILDSCHSGTATLGPSYKWISTKDPWVADVLSMPKTFIGADAGAGDSKSAGILMDGPGDHVLLAAAAADQVATAGNGGRPSVFTYYLLREIERGGTGQTFVDLITSVRAAVDEHRLRATSVIQVPQVEGGKARGTLAQFFPSAG